MTNITVNGVFVEKIEPFSKIEMQEILKGAEIGYIENRTYNPSLGVAIYNQLPIEITDIIAHSDQDMFHITDDDLAITMLLNLTEKI